MEQRFCTIVQDWIIFYILFCDWLKQYGMYCLKSNYFGMCLSQKSTLQFKWLSLLCSPRVHFFNQNYSKNSNIVKYFYNLKSLFSIWLYFKMLFIPVMQSWIFSIITIITSLQCHMILHKSLYYFANCSFDHPCWIKWSIPLKNNNHTEPKLLKRTNKSDWIAFWSLEGVSLFTNPFQ